MSYEDRTATWNNGVRKAIRRGAAENEVQKHRELMTGAWKNISTQRRRFEVNYDPGLLELLQEDTWKNDKDFEKTCARKRRADKNIQHPLYGTWVADFMLRPDEGRFFLGKCLSNKQIPWKRRRRLGIAVADVTATGSWLKKLIDVAFITSQKVV